MMSFRILILLIITTSSIQAQFLNGHQTICSPQSNLFEEIQFHSDESYIESIRTNKIGYIQGSESFKIYFAVNNPDIQSIKIEDDQRRLRRNGRGHWFTLYDDGSHGDEVPNDLIFTVDSLTIARYHVWTLTDAQVEFTYKDSSISKFEIEYRLSCVKVDTSVYKLPEITIINDSIQYTDYVTNIVTELSPFRGNYYDLRTDDQSLAKTFYKHFEDDRDFLAVWKPFPGYTANGSHYAVRNEVENIGRILADRSDEWGSNGVLQGFININNHQAAYYGLLRLLNHEILHQWCCLLEWDDNNPFKLHHRAGHWNPVVFGSSGFGRGGGNWAFSEISDIDSNGYYYSNYLDLDFYYNNLELYFMGLLPIDSVNVFPTTALINPDYISWNSGNLIFTADEKVNIEHNEYFELLKARSPEYPNNQNHFKIGAIAAYDRPLKPVEFAAFHYYMKLYETDTFLTFSWASRGRASIETKLNPKQVTKVDKAQASSVKIFPNPTSGILNVIKKDGMSEYVIIDISGRTIKRGYVIDQIDISSLSSGLYLLKLSDKTIKFIKI